MYTLNFPIHYPRCNSQGLGSELKTLREREREKKKGTPLKRVTGVNKWPAALDILSLYVTDTLKHTDTL